MKNLKNKEDMVMISIYALVNPLTTHVFYIGATKSPKSRLRAHIVSSKTDTSYKGLQIQEILKNGATVEMEILEECESTKAAFLECFYIDLFKSYGFNLTQSLTSYYPADRMLYYSTDMVNVRIKITKEMDDVLNIISDNSNFNKHHFILMAISDKIKKVIYSNNENYKMVKPELLRKFEISSLDDVPFDLDTLPVE